MRIILRSITTAFLFFISIGLYAQQSVAIGTATPDADAVLLLVGSGSQGLIIPIAADHNLVAKKPGMIVYNSTEKKVYYSDGVTWASLGGGTAAATPKLEINGNNISIFSGTNVPLAFSPPTQKGQLFMWDGSKWIATIGPAIPTTGQVLQWNGNSWVPGNAGGIASVTGSSTINIGGTVTDPTIAVNAGTGASQIPQLDSGGKLVTSVLPASVDTDITNDITTSTTATGDLSGTFPNLILGTTGVTATTYGSSTTIPQLTIDSKGRITVANNQTIPTASGAVALGLLSSTDFTTFSNKLNGNILTTSGDLLYHNGTSVTRLPRGANGEALLSTATGIQWTTLPGGGDMLKAAYDTDNDAVVDNAENVIYPSQAAKLVLATPTGAAGVPTFRLLVAGDIPTLDQNTTGSAATLTTGRTIGITGDLTYTSPSFNGSGNVTAAGTLATVNSNVGTFGTSTQVPQFTVNGKGLITAVSNVSITYTETDPIVKALNGIIKSNGTTISAAIPGTDFVIPNGAITGTTNTKITYDAKGLVTGGTTLVAGDIPNIAESQVTNLTTDLAAKQPQLSGIGFVKASGTTISYDNSTYLTTTGSAASLTSFPTLNQNTTGSAATLTTSRSIYGNAFNGSADITGIIGSAFGGTGNGFTQFTGPAAAVKTFTLPNASATILTSNAAVTVAQGGTGATTLTGVLVGTGTAPLTAIAGTPGQVLTMVGTTPTWTTAAGWGTSGNSGTNPATNYIGTSDGTDFVIKTNISNERMRFLNAGNTTMTGTTATTDLLFVHNLAGSGGFSAIAGQSDSPLGFGVHGFNYTGSTPGTGGDGVHGFSSNGNGVSGVSTSTNGVLGMSTANGTGVVGMSNTGTGIYGETTGGSSPAIIGYSFGGAGVSGQANIANQAGVFGRNDVANGFGIQGISTNGTGVTARSTSGSAGNYALSAIHSGSGDAAGFFSNDNAASNANSHGIYAQADGAGVGVFGATNGTGYGGQFQNFNAANSNAVVRIYNAGTGPGLEVGGAILLNSTTPTPTTDKLYNSGGNLFWNGTNISSGGGGGWGLSGNTVVAADYIGSNNNLPFNIKVNSLKSGMIDVSPGSENTFFGYRTAEGTGTSNTAFGALALRKAVAGGNFNTAVGISTLEDNNLGIENTAIGYKALQKNTNSNFNTAIGKSALLNQAYSNSGVAYNGKNTAIGHQALISNNPASSTSEGSDNTAIGYQAGSTNTIGQRNIFIGSLSGNVNAAGSNNTFIGYNASPATSGLSKAVAIGYNALVGSSNSFVLGGTGVDAVNVGIGTSTPAATAGISLNLPNAGTIREGIVVTNDFNSSGNKTGLTTNISLDGSGSHLGVYNTVNSGTTGPLYGVFNALSHTGTSGSIIGYYNSITNAATNASAVYGNSTVITNNGAGVTYGMKADVNKSAGIAGDVYGLSIEASNNGTANSYLLYGNSNGTTTGNEYGLWLTGEDLNYFSGSLGVGTSTASAKFDVQNATLGKVFNAVLTASGGLGQVFNFERTQVPSAGNDMFQLMVPTGSPTGFQFLEAQVGSNVVFRIDGNGSTYSDGTFNPGGADYAEMVEVSENSTPMEAGDVIVIDAANGKMLKSSQPGSTLVAGIFSTKPGIIGSEKKWVSETNTGDDGEQYTTVDKRIDEGEIPLAMLGIVPCKVSTENGPIQPGDLLITSNTPGHAMRADNPKAGTIVGKALQELKSGTGVIKVMVTLQ